MYTQTNLFGDDLSEEKSIIYESIEEAEQAAIERIKLASQFSEYYYHAPILIAYSGGKDSDVLLRLAQKSGVKYEVIHSVTTLDAPETNRHVNEVFERERERGINCIKHIPTYKGEQTNMWKLIEIKRVPPTRITRYCCKTLKETSTPNRLVCLGVRRAESSKRANRSVFEVRGKTFKEAQGYSMMHMAEAFNTALDEQELYGTDNNELNPSDCYMITTMKKKKNDAVVNPIVDWTDAMIWEYKNREQIPMNPLYAEGIGRVGCIGCPLAGSKKQKREFERYPKIREMYINAFQKMVNKRKADGLKTEWKTGEECMEWWLRNGGLGLTPLPSQERKNENDGNSDNDTCVGSANSNNLFA